MKRWHITGTKLHGARVSIIVLARDWDHARYMAAYRGIDWDKIGLID